MAKPITVTPTIKGADARKIERELREGTPTTAARESLFSSADRVFASLRASPFRIVENRKK